MSKITAVAKIWEKSDAGDGQTMLKFTAPYTDSEGNRINTEWAKYTPSFTLQMVVIDPVAEKFDKNTEYLLTFEER